MTNSNKQGANRFRFRAWHTEDRAMYPVDTLVNCAGGTQWHGPGVGHGWSHASMDSVTIDSVLMQSTGLTDKEGVEIYEGDVCKAHYMGSHYWKGVVSWDSKRGLWFWQMLTCRTIDIPIDKPCEVIGNIYENPELIKE